MGGKCIRNQVYETERYGQLNSHIYARNQRVAHLQFIGHQLVGMLAVGFSELLVQHDAVAYRHASVDSVYQKQYKPSDIACPYDEHAYGKEKDERDSYTSDISSEAFGFPFLSEIEYGKDEDRYHRDYQQRLVNKSGLEIKQYQWNQNSQRISGSDAVYTIHKIIDVCRTHAYYESGSNEQNFHPHVPAAEHKIVTGDSEQLPDE